MFDIQKTWMSCELTIDEGYNRKSRVVFYHGFTPQKEFELEDNMTINALLFIQDHGFEISNQIETDYGEVVTYYLSRKAI